jgi:hypothetical protein
MQIPEKYEEKFDVSSEGPSSGVTIANNLVTSVIVAPDEGPSLETSKFSSYFSGNCIPTNESLHGVTIIYSMHKP